MRYTVGNTQVTTNYNPSGLYDASSMNLDKFANLSPETQRMIGASGGTFGTDGSFKYDSANINSDYLKKPIADSALGSLNLGSANWGMGGWGGVALGVGQLGLGIASYLDQQKTASKQRHLMDQQAKQNDYNYKKTVADNKHIQQIFNPSNK